MFLLYQDMLDLIEKTKVTALHFVPSHLQVLVDHPHFNSASAAVHTVILIGESVPLNLYLNNTFQPAPGPVLLGALPVLS